VNPHRVSPESHMVAQCPGPSKSRKDHIGDLPNEVAEAISESGGLDRLLSAIKPDEIKTETALHRILSDKTRLTILRSIRQCDMCPCVLKVLMHISDSRLSYHLTVLEEARLITSYKKKNWKIYSITEKGRSI
jgi:DNA-binding transcriptional ArsR family regulator